MRTKEQQEQVQTSDVIKELAPHVKEAQDLAFRARKQFELLTDDDVENDKGAWVALRSLLSAQAESLSAALSCITATDETEEEEAP